MDEDQAAAERFADRMDTIFDELEAEFEVHTCDVLLGAFASALSRDLKEVALFLKTISILGSVGYENLTMDEPRKGRGSNASRKAKRGVAANEALPGLPRGRV